MYKISQGWKLCFVLYQAQERTRFNSNLFNLSEKLTELMCAIFFNSNILKTCHFEWVSESKDISYNGTLANLQEIFREDDVLVKRH